MRNLIANWLGKLAEKIRRLAYLDKYDLVEAGWKVVGENKRYIDFSKGKYTLKFEPKRMSVSIRYNKAPRFFGIIETEHDFSRTMSLINKYYKK